MFEGDGDGIFRSTGELGELVKIDLSTKMVEGYEKELLRAYG